MILLPLVEIGLTAAIGEIAATGAILGTGLTVAGLATNALFFGAALGASAFLTHRKGATANFRAPQGSVHYEPEVQSMPLRIGSYGRNLVGGKYLFRESDGSTLGYAVALGRRPIAGPVAYIADSETLDPSSGPVLHQTTTFGGLYAVIVVDEGPHVVWPVRGLKWVAFVGWVWGPGGPIPVIIGNGPGGFIEFRQASPDGAPSDLLRKYFGPGSPVSSGPGASPLWTDDHKAVGIPAVYSVWKAQGITDRFHTYPRGLPVLSVVTDGHLVHDPRDPASSFLDPLSGLYSVYNPTWRLTFNPSLEAADYLTDPDAYGLEQADLDWSTVAAAADYFDAPVPVLGGGTEPRAEAHFAFAADQPHRDVLNKVKAASDLEIYENEYGEVAFWPVQYEEPTVWLTDADLTLPISIKRMNGVLAETNMVTPSFTEPRTNFTQIPGVVVRDDASYALAGPRQSTLDLEAVHSFNQAYRIAHRVLARKNTPMAFSCGLKARGLLVDGEKFVGIHSERLQFRAVFRVVSLTIRSLGNIAGSFALVTPEMFADVVPPSDPINATVPVIGSLATSEPIQPDAPTATVTIAGLAATVLSAITPPNAMTPNPAIDPAKYSDTSSVARFHWRPVDPGTHAPLGVSDWSNAVIWTASAGQYAATSPVVTGVAGVPQAFEIQAWLVSPLGRPGPFSPSTVVTIAF